jgi:hypothetical protein
MNKWINKWNKNKICVENKCFGRLYKTKISYRSRWWNHLKKSYVVPNDYMNKVLNHERGLEKGVCKSYALMCGLCMCQNYCITP